MANVLVQEDNHFMCVLALAWRAHPRWHLVLAGNRDEYHARPARELGRWPGEGQIIAGRDLVSGGTWLGVSGTGRLAVVTNLRGYGAPDPQKLSRGSLVSDWLAADGTSPVLTREDPADFNPFNLIVSDRGGAQFLTNRPASLQTRLAHGLYGLSNGRLDEPWPKTMRLKERLLEWLMEDRQPTATLFEALREEDVPDMGFPAAGPSDIPNEPMLSSIFLRDPVYGTRCSTIVAVDHTGKGIIIERRYAPDAGMIGTAQHEFRWEL